jgi:D-3-phosphoglycerate dehydrogenase
VPGVIGHVGNVLGRNEINIANFSLGRREDLQEAIAVVTTDQEVSEKILLELKQNPAVIVAKSVELD